VNSIPQAPPPLLAPEDRLTMPKGARVVLTVAEAAEALTISPNKAVELMDAGTLRCIYIGRRRVVPVMALHQFVRDQLERQGQV
jgi:excisionase family DNA binding protein